MMETVKRVRRASRSKTIKWGHIQTAAGAVAAGLAFVNPATFADLPPWSYGVAAMVAGMITYVLRSVTRKPLDEK